jgi:hypothetical protein
MRYFRNVGLRNTYVKVDRATPEEMRQRRLWALRFTVFVFLPFWFFFSLAVKDCLK